MPKVLNIRRVGVCVPGAVNIMRPGPHGNPYHIGLHAPGRKGVLKLHMEYAEKRAAEEPEWLEALRGRDLLCCCAPKPCHGDNYLALLARKTGQARNCP